MAKFIMLVSYTDHGVQHFKEFEARMRHARHGAAELGITIDAFYLTMGEHDAVIVVDAPDARTAAKMALVNASNGRVRTITMPAFTEEETAAIAAELPA